MSYFGDVRFGNWLMGQFFCIILNSKSKPLGLAWCSPALDRMWLYLAHEVHLVGWKNGRIENIRKKEKWEDRNDHSLTLCVLGILII